MFKKVLVAAVMIGTIGSTFVLAETTAVEQPGNQGGQSQVTSAEDTAFRQQMKAIQEERRAMIKANSGKPLTPEQRKTLRDKMRQIPRPGRVRQSANTAVSPEAAPATPTAPAESGK
jgi:hypothetical protein